MSSLAKLAVTVAPSRCHILATQAHGLSSRLLQLRHRSSTLGPLPALATSPPKSPFPVRAQAPASTARSPELALAPGIGAPPSEPLGVSGAGSNVGAVEARQLQRASRSEETRVLEIPAADPWPVYAPPPDPSAPTPSLGATARQVADALAPWASRVQQDQSRLQGQWGQQSLPVLAYQGARLAFFLGTYFSQAVVLAPMLAQQQQQQGQQQQGPKGEQAPGKSSTANLLPSLSALQTAAQRLSRISSSMATRVIPGALELMRREAAYVAQGVYRAPYDMSPRHRQWRLSFAADAMRTSAAFNNDVIQRRQRNGWQETALFSEEARKNGDKYPEYYLQNFHFQDGWLSEFSAQGYEVATETLFLGMQDAMQRTGLVPLHYFMQGREEGDMVLADVACGTGRYLTFIKDNYPGIRTVGVDLSPQFLQKAEENMAYFEKFDKQVNGGRAMGSSEFVQAKAEELPFEDASVDVVSCVYLFHEIPEHTRRQVIQEMFRVVKPGGIVILNDSVQVADNPPVNVSFFPAAYHEPYYMSYQEENIPALFEEHGFRSVWASVAHFSKVWCFQKL